MEKKNWIPKIAAILLLSLGMAGCDRETSKAGRPAEPVEPEVAAQAVEPPPGPGDRSEIEVDVEDAGLTAAVKGRLAADPRVSALNIDVDTQNGIVTLKGNVQDAVAKGAAEEIARTTEGVTDVVNVLTVGPVGAQGGT